MVDALVTALRARGSDVARYTHRFHTYPARLHPDAARSVLSVLPGSLVLDPFCGGGTVLVEAMAAGRRALGRDVSPVALLVATARTRLLEPDERRALHDTGLELARHARTLVADGPCPLPRAVARLRHWYSPLALAELAALHELVEAVRGPERLLLRAVHSSLVVKYSRRQSDTSTEQVAVRDRKGLVVRGFRDRVVELVRMLTELGAAVGRDARAARVLEADARAEQRELVDLVCTSPPYPATYDYVAQQQLRLAWLSESADAPAASRAAAARRLEIGSRQSFRDSIDTGLARWARDTAQWLARAGEQLRPEGMLALMVGDGLAAGRCIPARPESVRAARAAGLELVAAASVERVDPGMRLAKREHALVFAKIGPTAPR